MPRTIAQLKRRLRDLKAIAVQTQAAIERVRDDVLNFGLRPEDIFPQGWPTGAEKAPANGMGFVSSTGETWSGRGRRPKWLVEALEQGADLEDFRRSGGEPSRRPHPGVAAPEPPKTTKSRDAIRARPSGNEFAPPSQSKVTALPDRTSASVAKYGDQRGGTWSGKGRRPRWLVEALAAGARLEDFKLKGAPRSRGPTAGGSPKRQQLLLYRDASGNEWHGKGRRPRWLVAALEVGAALEDFLVQSKQRRG